MYTRISRCALVKENAGKRQVKCTVLGEVEFALCAHRFATTLLGSYRKDWVGLPAI